MLALLELLVATSDAGLLRHKVTEAVVNDLPDNKTLTLHCCKRKGRDLGVKYLVHMKPSNGPSGQTFGEPQSTIVASNGKVSFTGLTYT